MYLAPYGGDGVAERRSFNRLDMMIPPKREIVIPKDGVKFILYQRTQHIHFTKSLWWRLVSKLPNGSSMYKKLVEREAIRRKKDIVRIYYKEISDEIRLISGHLPLRVDSILDIGCGIGGITVLLYQKYQAYKPRIYLLDRTLIAD